MTARWLAGALLVVACSRSPATTRTDLGGLDRAADPPDRAAVVDATEERDLSEPDLLPAPTCADGMKNGTESDVDCGGCDCPPCVRPCLCASNADCPSNVCRNCRCYPATCANGIRDPSETGVDCGGNCPLCPSVPSCTDGIANGAETDLDCGGTCPPCARCKRCKLAADCLSQLCTMGVCR